MKFVVLIVVMVIFILLGIYVYNKYLIRYKLYKDCEYVCKNLKNNICFNKNEINKLLSCACASISKFSRNIITQNVLSSIFIKKDDFSLINQFVSSLGKGDVTYEVNNLNFYENMFTDLKKSSYENLKTNGLMYLKLIIGIGIGVVIILI